MELSNKMPRPPVLTKYPHKDLEGKAHFHHSWISWSWPGSCTGELACVPRAWLLLLPPTLCLPTPFLFLYGELLALYLWVPPSSYAHSSPTPLMVPCTVTALAHSAGPTEEAADLGQACASLEACLGLFLQEFQVLAVGRRPVPLALLIPDVLEWGPSEESRGRLQNMGVKGRPSGLGLKVILSSEPVK